MGIELIDIMPTVPMLHFMILGICDNERAQVYTLVFQARFDLFFYGFVEPNLRMFKTSDLSQTFGIDKRYVLSISLNKP